jgi:hypothetical protein
MSEAVKRPLLFRRALSSDLGGRHRRIQVPPEHDSGREEPVTVLAREDQVIDRAAVAIAPSSEELNDVRDKVNIAPLAVLRCA